MINNNGNTNTSSTNNKDEQNQLDRLERSLSLACAEHVYQKKVT